MYITSYINPPLVADLHSKAKCAMARSWVALRLYVSNDGILFASSLIPFS